MIVCVCVCRLCVCRLCVCDSSSVPPSFSDVNATEMEDAALK